MDELIKEIFIEASNGHIRIGNSDKGYFEYYLTFYYKINGKCNATSDRFPIFEIADYSLFKEKIIKYLSIGRKVYASEKEYYELDDFSFDKRLIVNLFINCGISDFSNLLSYIDERTKMLSNMDFLCEKKIISNIGENDVVVSTTKAPSNLEGTMKFNCSIENDKDIFRLPTITFSKIGSEVYVYSVQLTNKNKQDSPLAKKMDRYIRKVNKNVDMDEIEGNVSPSALISFVIFMSYLKENNIKSVNGIPYMPIRYYGNLESGIRKHKDDTEKFLEIHDRNQYNITNKLMYLFLRYNHHFPNCEIELSEDKNIMNMKLNYKREKGDNIVYDFDYISREKIR